MREEFFFRVSRIKSERARRTAVKKPDGVIKSASNYTPPAWTVSILRFSARASWRVRRFRLRLVDGREREREREEPRTKLEITVHAPFVKIYRTRDGMTRATILRYGSRNSCLFQVSIKIAGLIDKNRFLLMVLHRTTS